jgi:hypothetical protein
MILADKGAEMPTVTAEFENLLDRLHGGEAPAAKKILELRPLVDAKTFRGLLSAGFDTRQAAEGVRLAELFDIRDLAQMLLETYLESKERAISIGAKLAASDPRFDAALFECLREVSAGSSDDALLVGLEILDAISERDRLVLNVLRLLKHENPKLRSKAALFIARRRPHLRWVSDLSQEPDARVRANTLESLFGIQEPFILPLFRQHVNDENNRVAGNAILGLYQLGETASIQHVEQMAKDERPLFRNTAVWVMGQTGDPRFSSVLSAQLSDSDKFVRRQALLGLGKIKQAFKVARERSRLRLKVYGHFEEAGREHLRLAAWDEAGEPVRAILGTRFLVKAGASFVREYNAQEHEIKTPVNVVYLECLPQKEENAAGVRLETVADGILELRRPKDKVVFSQFDYGAQLRCCADDDLDVSDKFTEALKDIDFNVSHLHLILVGVSADARIAGKVLEWAFTTNATVHLLAVAAEWGSADFLDRVNRRGGHAVAAEPHELGAACHDLHNAVLHHYRLDWAVTGGDLDLEVRADSGTGAAKIFKLANSASAETPAVQAPEEVPA